MKKRFSEEQIISFLQQAEAGVPIKELCRQYGFSDASFYNWRAKFGGMAVPDAKRLKELEAENSKLSGYWPNLSLMPRLSKRPWAESAEPPAKA